MTAKSQNETIRGKTVVITGASDGIGAEAARQLQLLGATVVIIGRSPEKTKVVADALHAAYYIADFAQLDEVRALAAKLRQDYPRIDILANNAGGIFGDRQLTVDGHEKTMQVNHLAHFLLTTLLMDVLVRSRATVINTSSVAHKLLSDFEINDLEKSHNYTPQRAYGNAKLENILFTKELHRRYHDRGISTAAFHPGNVATNFSADSGSFLRFVWQSPLKRLFGLISPAKGADTLVWLASSVPGKDWQSGEYYYQRHPEQVLALAHDDSLAQELWERSEQLLGGS